MLYFFCQSIVPYSTFSIRLPVVAFVPSVFQEDFSAEVLLYPGTILHFLSVSCSPYSLSLSLVSMDAYSFRTERAECDTVQHERADLLFHSACVSSLPFYNAFLPFSLVCITTRVQCIARARVFLENRGLLPWGRPTATDGLRNRRRSLTVCRGASAAPPSRLVLSPVASFPPASPYLFRPRPSIPVLSLLSSLRLLSLILSLALVRTPQVFKSSRFDGHFVAIANFPLSNPTRRSFPERL